MDRQLYKPFIDSTANIIFNMAGIEVAFDEVQDNQRREVLSFGVSSIITFAGKRKGRFLLDIEPSLAVSIAYNISSEHYNSENDYEMLSTISELNNTIAGDAVTVLNNIHSYGIRLAPPIVLAGKDAIISMPKLSSVLVKGKTKYGKIKISIAFEEEV